MRFTLTARIDPSGPFGVPEGGMTVLPAAPGEHHGPTFDSLQGEIVGYGALPVYRRDEDAIRADLATPLARIRLSDNFIFLEGEFQTSSEASAQLTEVLDRFLQHLTISQGRLYTFELIGLTNDEGQRVPLSRYFELMRVTTYDLKTLSRDLRTSARFVDLDSPTLALAIDYYELADLIFSKRALLVAPSLRQHSMLVSTAFLNLWKAISSIVGDPSVDSDYQRRYRDLGFSHDYFRNKIERVRKVRNDFDVAHYSLDPGHVDEVERTFGEASNIAADVLRRYRDKLAGKSERGTRSPA